MPSTLHEALIEMFRLRPSLAAELLTDALGISLPEYHQVRLESGDFPNLVPTEYRADAVVVLTQGQNPVLAVVIEVQLRRDRTKRWTWPVYLTTLRARLRCPSLLLVVCADMSIATWCAQPIGLGHPGWALSPLVLGPDQVPLVTDVDQASQVPELAALSVMAHATHPDLNNVLTTLLDALATLDEDRNTLYYDVIASALPAAARESLEALMASRRYEYKTDFARHYVFQGRAAGRIEAGVEAVLTVLKVRGIDVPEEARARITSCTSLDYLRAWVQDAVTADSIDDLFVGPPPPPGLDP